VVFQALGDEDCRSERARYAVLVKKANITLD
jgi:hypothetical protein